MKDTTATVGCSLGVKIGLPGYSSGDMSFFVNVPLEPGETVEKGMKRVHGNVMTMFRKLRDSTIDEIEKFAEERSQSRR